MITERQEVALTGKGDCQEHYHLADRATNAALQSAAMQASITASPYTVRSDDDFLLVDTSSTSITLTLPPARNGKEYEVIKVAAGNAVFIEPNAANGDTVLGSTTGVVIYNRFDALRLKAITGGWVAI